MRLSNTEVKAIHRMRMAAKMKALFVADFVFGPAPMFYVIEDQKKDCHSDRLVSTIGQLRKQTSPA